MRNILAVFLGMFLLNAFASAREPDSPEATAAEPTTAAAAPAGPLPADTVPKLHIVWDCGECTVNDKVIPLVEEAYRVSAAKAKKSVSDTHLLEARISDFRQRPPGLRVAVGIFAGKDRLHLKIQHDGQEHEVGDYSANAMQGMNHLCESVGERAFKKVASLVK